MFTVGNVVTHGTLTISIGPLNRLRLLKIVSSLAMSKAKCRTFFYFNAYSYNFEFYPHCGISENHIDIFNTLVSRKVRLSSFDPLPLNVTDSVTLATDRTTGWRPHSPVSTLLEWRAHKFVVFRTGQVTHCSGRARGFRATLFSDYMLADYKRTTGATFRRKKSR